MEKKKKLCRPEMNQSLSLHCGACLSPCLRGSKCNSSQRLLGPFPLKLQPKTEDQKQEGVAGPQHMEPQPCEGKDRFSSHDLPVRTAGRFAQQTPGIH